MEKKILVAKLADSLRDACLGGQAIAQLSSSYPELDIDDAYAIQLHNIDRCVDEGQAITGKKIGLTSLAMQQMLGVDEPDYGHLLGGMDMTGKDIPTAKLLQPKIEGELAFILKDDLTGPDVTVEDVLAATEFIVPAFEVVDSRVKDWKITIIDTVADNASSGGYILSSKRFSPQGLDLPGVAMKLYKNGELINEGTGKDVLGDPANCVAWLANKLSRYGIGLKKGEVVLSGALSAAPPAVAGDEFTADFGSLGQVHARFA